MNPSKSFYKDYKQIEKIAIGGQGIIQKVQKQSNQKFYVAKIIDCQNQEIISNVQNEYDLTFKLNFCREFVKVKDLYVDNVKEIAYLIFEYIPWKTLDKILAKKQFLQEKVVKNIVLKLLESVNQMHKVGICHRDLNPMNILVDKEFQNLKIIDMGIAKYIFDQKKLTKFRLKEDPIPINKLFTQAGTPMYTAPEVLGFSDIGYCMEIDLWSVGIITYQLLCGNVPFESIYEDDTMDVIQNEELSFKSPQWEHVSNLAKDFC